MNIRIINYFSNFGLFLAMALTVVACKKDNVSDFTTVKDIQIINNSGSALQARVLISTTDATNITIRCRKADETHTQYTITSVGKTNHKLSIFGLEEQTDYELEITTDYPDKAHQSHIDVKQFTTASIPSWIHDFYNEEDNKINDQLQGYYYFASMSNPGCLYLINNKGEVIWYQIINAVVKSSRITQNGTILSILDENGTHFGDGNVVLETSLEGDTLFIQKLNEKGFDKWVHHDLIYNHKGNIVAATNHLKNNMPGDGLVEWNKSGNKVWEWSTFDNEKEINPLFKEQPWLNSIFEDEDNNYILSLRSLHQVWKVNSKTGRVLWKLGKEGNIQIEDNAIFLRQHYAHRNSKGEIMLFDNGSESRPYSRILAFEIDEEKLTAKKTIDVQLPIDNYSPIMGSTSLLPDNNLLAASSSSNTALKLDLDGRILWTIKTKSPFYRIEYIYPNILPIKLQ